MASSSGKCDTTTTNAERDPQQTPLAAVASIQPLSYSITMDMDATIRDDPPTTPSTKSQTRTVEDHRSSNSASASRCVACSTLSRVAASSRRPASQA
jgi:hypothetical protein